jgi:hypothetical protein
MLFDVFNIRSGFHNGFSQLAILLTMRTRTSYGCIVDLCAKKACRVDGISRPQEDIEACEMNIGSLQ